jgi:hypothetical protein
MWIWSVKEDCGLRMFEKVPRKKLDRRELEEHAN